ncbi:PREDICTED: gamma-glutamyltranspeptidase 1-like [Branchiostoma belcheri]|uniref:Glutathione hydrolase n=1 Tax=Branchiostoma belcheri TaxID=7741 RepID=A0A6P4Z645_BRABE|nr:PREDICTED: gamma-glutamyltranspeptidase 1-like [Branchiostoma belcheri]
MQAIAKHLSVAAVALVIAFLVQVYQRQSPSENLAGRLCHGARPSDRDAAGGPYNHGAVASDSAVCSQIGRDVLVNGSAVDAAIATLLCLGVVHPQSLGLGGGFLMTVYNKATGTSQVIDARETTPLAATEDMFVENPDLSTMGGISVSVPGQVRGLWEAHQRYGQLPWRDLFRPAIRLAEEGACMGKHLATSLKRRKDVVLDRTSGFCDVFCDEDGAMLRENMTVKRPQLAKTLLAVANGGADAFYTGEIAKNFVKDIQERGGIMSEQDLLNYRAEVRVTLNTSLPGGLTLLTPPPPSAGATVILALNILEGYGLNSSVKDSLHEEALMYHRMLEALKFALVHGMELGDPKFVNIAELTKKMASKEFADELRRKIDDTRMFDISYYGPAAVSPDVGGTSHVSVLGPNGDAVSATSSIGRIMGARFRSLSTGIIPNNHMELFTLPNQDKTRRYSPTPGRAMRPGKRGVTSFCPTVVLDGSGDVRLVIGASGGAKLTTAVTDAMVHHFLLGWNISSAIEKPRLHISVTEDIRGILYYEKHRPFKPKAVLQELEKIHGKATPEPHQAMVQAVVRENSAIFAHSDSRKGGFPSGF